MSGGWIAVIVIGLMIVLGVLFIVSRKQTAAKANPKTNVIRMTEFKRQDKRSSAHLQKCSYCKKKTDRLTFYAGVHGSAVGVCKECRSKAEKQDLLPL
ncbi:hypothetical protein [Paenibacillus sp. 32352]|uniref:hypothetical protein n=1 Tax=Paenibacillus sp. 32352 TaxID=1969111 RepID=UPI0009AD778C|nr:hypothetical protein [Paenibacillus sp. 32352]